jgi:molecular chaperone GrpE
MSKHDQRAEDAILGPDEANPDEQSAAVATESPAPDGEQAQDASIEAELELDVEQLTAKAAERDELFAIAQRVQADFENYRKRMTRELEGAQARGIARLAGELVPALDNLERAIDGAAGATVVDEQLLEGLRLVQRELSAALARAGVERFCEPGDDFDPNLHEAVSHGHVEGAKAGSVVEVYQPGYRFGGAVIRAARVRVAA